MQRPPRQQQQPEPRYEWPVNPQQPETAPAPAPAPSSSSSSSSEPPPARRVRYGPVTEISRSSTVETNNQENTVPNSLPTMVPITASILEKIRDIIKHPISVNPDRPITDDRRSMVIRIYQILGILTVPVLDQEIVSIGIEKLYGVQIVLKSYSRRLYDLKKGVEKLYYHYLPISELQKGSRNTFSHLFTPKRLKYKLDVLDFYGAYKLFKSQLSNITVNEFTSVVSFFCNDHYVYDIPVSSVLDILLKIVPNAFQSLLPRRERISLEGFREKDAKISKYLKSCYIISNLFPSLIYQPLGDQIIYEEMQQSIRAIYFNLNTPRREELSTFIENILKDPVIGMHYRRDLRFDEISEEIGYNVFIKRVKRYIAEKIYDILQPDPNYYISKNYIVCELLSSLEYNMNVSLRNESEAIEHIVRIWEG